MEERPAPYANKPRTSARLRQHAARWAFACLIAVALALIAAMPLLAQPMPAFGAGGYSLTLTAPDGTSLLNGGAVDPDALQGGMGISITAPDGYQDSNANPYFGIRLSITDSSGNSVCSVRSIWAVRNVEPGTELTTQPVLGVVLLPGESYTVQVTWIDCSHSNGVSMAGTSGERIVQTQSFGFSTLGAPDGSEEGGSDEDGDEIVPPAESAGPEGGSEESAPQETGGPAEEENAPEEDAVEEGPREAGVGNDEAVSDYEAGDFSGLAPESGNVRPEEGAQTEEGNRQQNRGRAAEALAAASEGKEEKSTGAEALAASDVAENPLGLSADQIASLGTVRAMKLGGEFGDADSQESAIDDLRIEVGLSLRMLVLLALLVAALPVGVALRLGKWRFSHFISSRLSVMPG